LEKITTLINNNYQIAQKPQTKEKINKYQNGVKNEK